MTLKEFSEALRSEGFKHVYKEDSLENVMNIQDFFLIENSEGMINLMVSNLVVSNVDFTLYPAANKLIVELYKEGSVYLGYIELLRSK